MLLGTKRAVLIKIQYTKHMFKIMGKKIITVLRYFCAKLDLQTGSRFHNMYPSNTSDNHQTFQNVIAL